MSGAPVRVQGNWDQGGEIIMLYHIKNLCPRQEMSGAGFGIDLWPAWKDAVTESKLTQEMINTAITNMHRFWLDGCGFGGVYDPDNSGFDRDETKPPGPNARPIYGPYDIRISWGEWGPEHISVPGNACGLDIWDSIGGPRGGKSLGPHNVDSIRQAHLLLVVFTWVAEGFVLNLKQKEYKSK